MAGALAGLDVALGVDGGDAAVAGRAAVLVVGVQAPVVLHATVAPLALDAGETLAHARHVIALLRAQPVAVAF